MQHDVAVCSPCQRLRLALIITTLSAEHRSSCLRCAGSQYCSCVCMYNTVYKSTRAYTAVDPRSAFVGYGLFSRNTAIYRRLDARDVLAHCPGHMVRQAAPCSSFTTTILVADHLCYPTRSCQSGVSSDALLILVVKTAKEKGPIERVRLDQG